MYSYLYQGFVRFIWYKHKQKQNNVEKEEEEGAVGQRDGLNLAKISLPRKTFFGRRSPLSLFLALPSTLSPSLHVSVKKKKKQLG